MSRKQWVTLRMKELLSDPDWKIKIDEPGGDVDTETLILTANSAAYGEHLFVAGFKHDGDNVETPDDAVVDAIEVSDGQDSRGGLNSSDEPTCIMYGRVCARLRKAGWEVVPSMDDYF